MCLGDVANLTVAGGKERVCHSPALRSHFRTVRYLQHLHCCAVGGSRSVAAVAAAAAAGAGAGAAVVAAAIAAAAAASEPVELPKGKYGPGLN